MTFIPVDTTVGPEVRIHTFGAIGVGMLTVLAFPICSQLLLSIMAWFLVYIAVIHIVVFVRWLKGHINTVQLSISLLKYVELLL